LSKNDICGSTAALPQVVKYIYHVLVRFYINASVSVLFLAGCMTEGGLLKVDKYLRVIGQEILYAVGDVNDVDEEKMAYTGKLQVDVLLYNLKAMASNSSPKAYKPGMFVMGQNRAVMGKVRIFASHFG